MVIWWKLKSSSGRVVKEEIGDQLSDDVLIAFSEYCIGNQLPWIALNGGAADGL